MIRCRRSNEYDAIALLNIIQSIRSSANRCNFEPEELNGMLAVYDHTQTHHSARERGAGTYTRYYKERKNNARVINRARSNSKFGFSQYQQVQSLTVQP